MANPLNITIFNGYVSLPEGKPWYPMNIHGPCRFQISRPQFLSTTKDLQILPAGMQHHSDPRFSTLIGNWFIAYPHVYQVAGTWGLGRTSHLPKGDAQWNWDVLGFGEASIKPAGKCQTSEEYLNYPCRLSYCSHWSGVEGDKNYCKNMWSWSSKNIQTYPNNTLW